MPEELTPAAAAALMNAPRCHACKALLQAGRPNCPKCGAPKMTAKCRLCGAPCQVGESRCVDCMRRQLASLEGMRARLPDGLSAEFPSPGSGFAEACGILAAVVGLVGIGVSAGAETRGGHVAGVVVLSIAWTLVLVLLVRGAVLSALRTHTHEVERWRASQAPPPAAPHQPTPPAPPAPPSSGPAA